VDKESLKKGIELHNARIINKLALYFVHKGVKCIIACYLVD